MGVKVRGLYLNSTGGGGIPTQFSTTFPSLNDFRSSFGNIGSSQNDWNVGANRLIVGVGSNGGSSFHCTVPHLIGGIAGRSQFSQFVLEVNNGTVANPTRPTLFLFARGISSVFENNLSCFMLRVLADTPVLLIQTTNTYIAPFDNVTIATTATVPVAGDTLRFEGQLIAGPLVDLTAKINGVTVLNVTSALVPGTGIGLPGLGCTGNPGGGGVRFEVSNYQCGLL